MTKVREFNCMLYRFQHEAHTWGEHYACNGQPLPEPRRRLDNMTDDRLDELYADLERAGWVAVALENENRRLEDRAKEASERARVATVHAYRLHLQTPDAAQRTLDRVRQATSWGDLWVQLGMYYGLKPEECGAEARARRLSEVRRVEQRAETAEQQLAASEAWSTRLRQQHDDDVRKLNAVRAECDAIEREPYHIGDYEAARRIRTAMHEAATGRTGMGPVRGVVEDMTDVRAERDSADRRAHELYRRRQELEHHVENLTQQLDSAHRRDHAADSTRYADDGVRIAAATRRAETAERQLAEAEHRIGILDAVDEGRAHGARRIMDERDEATKRAERAERCPACGDPRRPHRGCPLGPLVTAPTAEQAPAHTCPDGEPCPAPDDPADRCPSCHTAPCADWCHQDDTEESPR